MSRQAVQSLQVTTFREGATGEDLNAARVDGWIVWEANGEMSYVESDDFERDYEKAPNADQNTEG